MIGRDNDNENNVDLKKNQIPSRVLYHFPRVVKIDKDNNQKQRRQFHGFNSFRQHFLPESNSIYSHPKAVFFRPIKSRVLRNGNKYLYWDINVDVSTSLWKIRLYTRKSRNVQNLPIFVHQCPLKIFLKFFFKCFRSNRVIRIQTITINSTHKKFVSTTECN